MSWCACDFNCNVRDCYEGHMCTRERGGGWYPRTFFHIARLKWQKSCQEKSWATQSKCRQSPLHDNILKWAISVCSSGFIAKGWLDDWWHVKYDITPVCSFFELCTSEVTGVLMTSSGFIVSFLLCSTGMHVLIQSTVNYHSCLSSFLPMDFSMNSKIETFMHVLNVPCNDIHPADYTGLEIPSELQWDKPVWWCLRAKVLVAGQICPQYNRLTSVFVLLWIIGGPKLSW